MRKVKYVCKMGSAEGVKCGWIKLDTAIVGGGCMVGEYVGGAEERSLRGGG